MKRRHFLRLIGAAGSAPLLPAMGAAHGGALYSRTLYSRAVMHARLRPHVSARGIAYRLKVSVTQAEGMIAEMASKGLVRPIVGGGGVHVRAFSSIVKPQAFGAGSGVRQARARATHQRPVRISAQQPGASSPLMDHLHQLCRDYGLPLSPRAHTIEARLA